GGVVAWLADLDERVHEVRRLAQQLLRAPPRLPTRRRAPIRARARDGPRARRGVRAGRRPGPRGGTVRRGGRRGTGSGARAAPQPDVRGVVVIRVREVVIALPACHEVELLALLRGVINRPDAGAARAADRTRRQAFYHVRVVGRLVAQLAQEQSRARAHA